MNFIWYNKGEGGGIGLLGVRIVQARKRRGWTQGQLATYTKVKQSYLSMIEGGQRDNPSIDKLEAIATALRTSLDYLVGRTNDPRPLAIIQSPESQSLMQQVGDLLADPIMEKCFKLLIALTPEDRADIYNYVRYVAVRRQEDSP